MNNPHFYQQLAELKIQEIQREIKQDRLIKEARSSKVNWLACLVNALLNLLRMKSRALQNHRSTELRSYQPCRNEAVE
jgi:hypothetical protein